MNSPARVLIIDDESEIREGVARWLGAAGYTSFMAGDGEEGLRAATQVGPDAILLDMLMPKLDGMQTLKHLRVDERTQNVPVVMLSASLRDQQRALDAGATFFVPKPYDGRHLVSTVQASLAAK